MKFNDESEESRLLVLLSFLSCTSAFSFIAGNTSMPNAAAAITPAMQIARYRYLGDLDGQDEFEDWSCMEKSDGRLSTVERER